MRFLKTQTASLLNNHAILMIWYLENPSFRPKDTSSNTYYVDYYFQNEKIQIHFQYFISIQRITNCAKNHPKMFDNEQISNERD